MDRPEYMRHMQIRRHWTDIASCHLKGRKIVAVRYLTHEEKEHLGWFHSAPVLQLDDDTLVLFQSDDEGNDAGAGLLLLPGEGFDSVTLPRL